MLKNEQPRLYRRHLTACSLPSPNHHCDCPIWVYGVVDGVKIRKSLQTSSLEHAREQLDLGILPPQEPIDEVLVAKCILAIHAHREEPSGLFVYFIAAGTGSIKIGSTTDVDDRIAGLQTGSCSELRIKRVFRGGRALEKVLHDHLSHCKRRGEWFRLTATLRALLRRTRGMSLYAKKSNFCTESVSY